MEVSQGLKNKANGMKQETINAARDLVTDVNCLLGKCKNKTQEDKLKFESNKVLNSKGFESKKYIDDPYLQMQLVKNSDQEVEIGQNPGSFVSFKFSNIFINF